MLDHESRGEGRTIVFLHGLTLDRSLLLDACEPIFAERAGWRRIYLDLPGHGRSPGEPAAASADGLLASVHELLVDIAGPRPLLVGHAYGGYLAQGLVAAGPEVGGLFLVCPVVEPDLTRRRVPPQRVATPGDGLVFADDDERQVFHGEATVHSAGVLDAFRRLVVPAHAATDRDFLAAVRGRYVISTPLGAAARAFTGPVAIVCGRDDYWSGFVDAAGVAALYPRSSLTVVPDCGQLLPIEAGDRLRDAFLDWLGRLAADVDVR